jgi:hypothetical protein
MKDYRADKLHVESPLAYRTFRGFSDGGESLRQNLVEDVFLDIALLVAKLRDFIFEPLYPVVIFFPCGAVAVFVKFVPVFFELPAGFFDFVGDLRRFGRYPRPELSVLDRSCSSLSFSNSGSSSFILSTRGCMRFNSFSLESKSPLNHLNMNTSYLMFEERSYRLSGVNAADGFSKQGAMGNTVILSSFLFPLTVPCRLPLSLLSGWRTAFPEPGRQILRVWRRRKLPLPRAPVSRLPH